MSGKNRFPGAEFNLLGKQTESRMTSHDIICLHTMVGGLAGTEAFFQQDGFGGTESHFGVGARGETIQWQSLEFSADANLDGNHRVISIETADSGNPFDSWTGTNVPGWTPAQIEAIVDLTSWLCRRFDIPPRLIEDTKPGRRGIGYHRQGISGAFKDGIVAGGERWSESEGKVCPGDRRIRQLKSNVIPKLRAALDKPVGKPKGKPKGKPEPAPDEPVVGLGRIVRAAEHTVMPGVAVVERALVAEGLLDENRVNGIWAPVTTAAYAKWQKRCGLKGAAADGIPGEKSLAKLGAAHGFRVRSDTK